MKKLIIVLMLFGISFGANAGEFEVKLEEFTSVRAQGNYTVILKKGDAYKAEITNDDATVEDDKIILEVIKEELRIRIKGDTYKERVIEIVVTYVDLEEVNAKMGCKVEVEGVMDVDKIAFESESGGKIKAAVNSKRVNAKISAGGSIHLEGTTDKAYYSVSAGGTIATVSLKATKVDAEVKAGGEIICSVIEELAIKITSGGNVSYMGNPEAYEEKITLGGKVTKMKSQN